MTLHKKTRLSRRLHASRKIVHDVKNCMSVLLLNLGNFEADPDHIPLDLHTMGHTIRKMNCLPEELVKSLL